MFPGNLMVVEWSTVQYINLRTQLFCFVVLGVRMRLGKHGPWLHGLRLVVLHDTGGFASDIL